MTGLKEIIIPDSIETIEHEAFMDCTNIEYVRYGYNLTFVGYDSFRRCTNIKSIIVNSKVTLIGSGLYWGCPNLHSINFPANVETLD